MQAFSVKKIQKRQKSVIYIGKRFQFYADCTIIFPQFHGNCDLVDWFLMLFEKTYMIANDFDWFLQFIPPNSVEKRKNSKNHPEKCIKNRQHNSFACLLLYVRAIKGFFHASFYDASESHRQQLQSKSKCQRPTPPSSSCLPISCCPSSLSMPLPEIVQLLSGKTTAAAELSC